MDQTIFETSFLGFKVSVFKNQIVYRNLLTRHIIPVRQIASVEVGIPGMQQIIIETTGGKKHKIVVRLRDKEKLVQTITNIQNGNSERTN